MNPRPVFLPSRKKDIESGVIKLRSIRTGDVKAVPEIPPVKKFLWEERPPIKIPLGQQMDNPMRLRGAEPEFATIDPVRPPPRKFKNVLSTVPKQPVVRQFKNVAPLPQKPVRQFKNVESDKPPATPPRQVQQKSVWDDTPPRRSPDNPMRLRGAEPEFATIDPVRPPPRKFKNVLSTVPQKPVVRQFKSVTTADPPVRQFKNVKYKASFVSNSPTRSDILQADVPMRQKLGQRDFSPAQQLPFGVYEKNITTLPEDFESDSNSRGALFPSPVGLEIISHDKKLAGDKLIMKLEKLTDELLYEHENNGTYIFSKDYILTNGLYDDEKNTILNYPKIVPQANVFAELKLNREYPEFSLLILEKLRDFKKDLNDYYSGLITDVQSVKKFRTKYYDKNIIKFFSEQPIRNEIYDKNMYATVLLILSGNMPDSELTPPYAAHFSYSAIKEIITKSVTFGPNNMFYILMTIIDFMFLQYIKTITLTEKSNLTRMRMKFMGEKIRVVNCLLREMPVEYANKIGQVIFK